MVNRGATCFQVVLCMIRLICYLIFSRRAEQACVTLDFQQTGLHFSCYLFVISLSS